MDKEDWLAVAEAVIEAEAAELEPAAVEVVPSPATTPSELARVAALHEYRLLDAPADDELTAVVRAAAVVAGVPHATLNLIDENRQCQLTTVGFEGADSARGDSMCALHFESGELVHVPDASCDPRYVHNPWVDGRLASVRFYASAPLMSPTGHALGSLCVFDTVPGQLNEVQMSVLEDLAGVLVGLFERRRQARLAAEQAEQTAEARELAVLAMNEAEARWELSEVVADTVDVGLAVAGPDGHLTMLNPTARAWYGADVDADLTSAERARAKALFAADGVTALGPEETPLHRALREGSVQGMEIVLAPAGLPRRTVVCTGRLMRRSDGTPLGAVVAMTDVTAARTREAALTQAHDALAEAHAELAEHTARVEALAQASRILVTAEDPHEAVCEAARNLTGADGACLLQPGPDGSFVATASVGLPAVPVAVGADEPSLAATAVKLGEALFVPDIAAHPRASQQLARQLGIASCVWQPVVLTGNRTVGALGVLWRERRDDLPAHVLPMLQTLSGEAAHVIERADLLARLAEAAERDPLTGLANRRRWDEAVAAEIHRAERSGAPLTLALLDLDHFKRYNDTHGHLAGDALLRDFAAAATSCLRTIDTLARWGGEEFVLALPGCTAADARTVVERIRAVVPHGQTCTVGIAEWTSGLQADEVVDRADAALYRGKQAGRDTTVLHTAPGVPLQPETAPQALSAPGAGSEVGSVATAR
ncbi:diguanylate cyclase domain-containing protein [Kineococcus glutinatus]|uniref:GGDEF domain-containing protein n=1 Tax=Kineococcus glutinatus TaxID=1070872 RepID=A0ABP9HNV9_9ACTN